MLAETELGNYELNLVLTAEEAAALAETAEAQGVSVEGMAGAILRDRLLPEGGGE